jgi:succinate dehydrogenase hydrophobic anchor subunit
MKVEKEGNTMRYMLGLIVILVLLLAIYYGFTVIW